LRLCPLCGNPTLRLASPFATTCWVSVNLSLSLLPSSSKNSRNTETGTSGRMVTCLNIKTYRKEISWSRVDRI
jgi:hypothetical protein